MKDLEFLSVIQQESTLDPCMYQYFDQLLNHRTIIFNNEIDQDIFETVILPLRNFEKDISMEPVTLYLNTPGGSVADGLILCNIIDNYTKPLEIIVPSYACSMGTIILCSGNKNTNVKKKCYPFSFALFHSGQTFVEGETSSVEDVMAFNNDVNTRVKKYIINNTKISEELYDAYYRKQWYLSAAEMKEYGLVHEIIGE